MPLASLAVALRHHLELEHPPVAVTFHEQPPTEPGGRRPVPQPAGCCFWSPAETARLVTTAADHAGCSIGSFTHGLIPLAEAAAGEDTGALLASGWVGEADLTGAPRVSSPPAAITYEPLDQAETPHVVLIRLTPASLMTLQGACPELSLATKPQCQIVPLAIDGRISVSPGCAVSRVRTGLPPGELTCAIPAGALPDIVERIERARAADTAVAAYARAGIEADFRPDDARQQPARPSTYIFST